MIKFQLKNCLQGPHRLKSITTKWPRQIFYHKQRRERPNWSIKVFFSQKLAPNLMLHWANISRTRLDRHPLYWQVPFICFTPFCLVKIKTQKNNAHKIRFQRIKLGQIQFDKFNKKRNMYKRTNEITSIS